MRFFICVLIAIEIFQPLKILAEQTKVLHVGFIGPFSGPVQAYGEASKNGFELALSEIGKDKIRVTYEDDQFVPAKTVAAFNKLTQVNKVDLVLSIGSATSNAIAPLAESRHIPLIAWASDTQSSMNRQSVIRSFPSGEAEGKRTAEEGLKRKYTKIGVITATHDYPLSWHRGLMTILAPDSVILDEEVPPDMRDFKSLLLKARQKGVENFIVCILAGQVGVFAKQSRELGLKAHIGGCIFLEDENEVKLAHGALAGAWYITTPISSGFVQKYEKKHGNVNAITGAAIHYDVAMLLSTLIKENHLTDITKSLLDLGKFDGMAGPLTLRKENGDQFFDYSLIAKEIASTP